MIPALPFLEVFFLGRRDTWDWLFALVIQVYAVAAKHDERARETCILSAQPGSDLRVRIHAHHIHVASQLLALRTRDVADLVKASDGSWRTVDSTWNDNGSLSMQDWLMIDQDKPAQGYRKYNSQALVDAQIDSVPGYRAHME